MSFAWAGGEPSLVCSRRHPAAASADWNSIMALFGSLWSCCWCCLYLGLLLDHCLVHDGAAANTVTEKDPVGVCMWPRLESAVMSCDSPSVVWITEMYITRLVGRPDKCEALHAASKPEYPYCRLPVPTDLREQILDHCNNTKHCTLGSFIKGPTVVSGTTTCGNGTDMVSERNFLVIYWGCFGVPTTQKLTNNLLWLRNEGRAIYVGREALQQCLLSLALLVVVVLQFERTQSTGYQYCKLLPLSPKYCKKD